MADTRIRVRLDVEEAKRDLKELDRGLERTTSTAGKAAAAGGGITRAGVLGAIAGIAGAVAGPATAAAGGALSRAQGGFFAEETAFWSKLGGTQSAIQQTEALAAAQATATGNIDLPSLRTFFGITNEIERRRIHGIEQVNEQLIGPFQRQQLSNAASDTASQVVDEIKAVPQKIYEAIRDGMGFGR